ncbi:hypothetical protein [Lysobacter gummosus]
MHFYIGEAIRINSPIRTGRASPHSSRCNAAIPCFPVFHHLCVLVFGCIS